MSECMCPKEYVCFYHRAVCTINGQAAVHHLNIYRRLEQVLTQIRRKDKRIWSKSEGSLVVCATILVLSDTVAIGLSLTLPRRSIPNG